MAHSNQAKKRLRQNEKRRIYNKSIKSEIKTLTKSFTLSVQEKDRETADALFPRVVSKLDRAARHHVYHRNTVARRKSRVAKLYDALRSAEAN